MFLGDYSIKKINWFDLVGPARRQPDRNQPDWATTRVVQPGRVPPSAAVSLSRINQAGISQMTPSQVNSNWSRIKHRGISQISIWALGLRQVVASQASIRHAGSELAGVSHARVIRQKADRQGPATLGLARKGGQVAWFQHRLAIKRQVCAFDFYICTKKTCDVWIWISSLFYLFDQRFH